MTTTDEPMTRAAADLPGGGDAPGLSCRDAAALLVDAVGKAGPPWRFVPADSLAGTDVVPVGFRSWPVSLPGGRLAGVVLRGLGASSHDQLLTVLLGTVSALAAAEQALAEATKRLAVAEQQARIDPMTGLLNRRAWEEAVAAELARMRRHDTTAAVVVIDIDGLKEANDTQGHLMGDLLIRRAAAAIRSAVREEDVVARTGGDEFAVLAVEAESPVPDSVLHRIRTALEDADVPASAGAAAARGPSESLDDAIVRADAAMYGEKRQNRAARARPG